MTDGDFFVRAMTASDAQSVASWRYPKEYAFYDADADPDDLAELLDAARWGTQYFAVDDRSAELVGFVEVTVTEGVAEIGLGLRPDLTGRGTGAAYVQACLRFAASLGAESYTLTVAAFNQRAITVYERCGFRVVERYDHVTNGAVHPFIRMSRGPTWP